MQLTEADGGERRSLHDGSMPFQQVSRASLCHLLNLKREEEESRSQPPPFRQSFPVFLFIVDIWELDGRVHASWQWDRQPQTSLPERVLPPLSSV